MLVVLGPDALSVDVDTEVEVEYFKFSCEPEVEFVAFVF